MLTNVAAACYFRRAGRFRPIRHGLLPIGGAALMAALLVGQVIDQTVSPYTWLPWIVVGWVVLVGGAAAWVAASRPHRVGLVAAAG